MKCPRCNIGSFENTNCSSKSAEYYICSVRSCQFELNINLKGNQLRAAHIIENYLSFRIYWDDEHTRIYLNGNLMMSFPKETVIPYNISIDRLKKLVLIK